MSGIKYKSQINMPVPPTEPQHVARLSDLTGALSTHNTGETTHVDIREDITALTSRVTGLENLGSIAGIYDNFATPQAAGKTIVPTNADDFPDGVTINDFVFVRKDETQSNMRTMYLATAIGISGNITWEFSWDFPQDMTGKMDLLTAFITGNLVTVSATGEVIDSGHKPADFAPANAALTAETGTGTTITTPAVTSATIAGILQTIWNKIRQVVNVLGTKCANDDTRLSDARTPTSHAANATTYGAASQANLGHTRVTMSTDADKNTSIGTAARDNMALGYRHYITGTQDFNDYRTTGEYHFYLNPSSIANSFTPKQTTSTGCYLKVISNYNNTYVIQICWPRTSLAVGTAGAHAEMWMRYSTTASTWSSWERVGMASEIAITRKYQHKISIFFDGTSAGGVSGVARFDCLLSTSAPLTTYADLYNNFPPQMSNAIPASGWFYGKTTQTTASNGLVGSVSLGLSTITIGGRTFDFNAPNNNYSSTVTSVTDTVLAL